MKSRDILKKHIVPYENRIVAFFDLQGFKEKIIPNCPAEEIGAVFGYFAAVQNLLERDYPNLLVTIISDSIVVSSTLNDISDLQSFFEACTHYVTPKIGTDFFAVRGGIAYGELHHKDNIVFGPALIEAYNLSEKQQGIRYLRTTMKKETFQMLSKIPDAGSFIKAFLFPTEEGCYRFDPWLFEFAMLSLDCDKRNWKRKEEIFNTTVILLEKYLLWCILNARTYKNKRQDIFEKYSDLMVQTIMTFKMVKEVYLRFLPEKDQKVICQYSDEMYSAQLLNQKEEQT